MVSPRPLNICEEDAPVTAGKEVSRQVFNASAWDLFNLGFHHRDLWFYKIPGASSMNCASKLLRTRGHPARADSYL
jgi:hypothetical protein